MGQIIKRHGTDYWTIIYQHTAPDGSRKPKWESCKGLNWNQAKARLRERETRDSRGEPVSESKATVAEYLALWLERVKGTIADSTHYIYTVNVRKQLAPAFGACQLARLQPGQIQDQYREWEKTLAPKSIRNLHNLLHRAMKQAVRWEMIFRNPVDLVDPPRVMRPEIIMPTPKQARAILRALYGTEWYLPALICLATGARRGEVLGLRWKDFDAGKRAIIIQRALSRTTDTGVTAKDTKSGRARKVKIGRKLRMLLVWHNRRSVHTAPGDYLCCKEDGTHLSLSGFSRAFSRIARKHGVEAGPHSLRHLHISSQFEARTPAKAISELAGHASVGITNDRYAHFGEMIQDEAAAVSDDLLGG